MMLHHISAAEIECPICRGFGFSASDNGDDPVERECWTCEGRGDCTIEQAEERAERPWDEGLEEP